MNEKQLARYLRAVRRRLPLSGQMKDRVMDDLRSSINERREAGQTDAEIFAALGPAKQAAAELTAQLPGYAFRKSPLRFVCLGAALLALLAGLLKTVTNLCAALRPSALSAARTGQRKFSSPGRRFLIGQT